MSERTFVVTGANTGIGRVTALELARAGHRVILACRNPTKTEPVIEEIRRETGNAAVEFAALDLGSLASVKACAEGLLEREEKIHVLINNAGLAAQKGMTADGFEQTFGVNHLGHFYLTQLLTDRIVESGTEAEPARIVIVASKAHFSAKKLDLRSVREPMRGLTGLREYNHSKLCNVLHARELSRRMQAEGKPVRVYSLHPGVVASDIWRRMGPLAHVAHLFMITNEEGAKTTLHCALSDSAREETGLYYDKCKSFKPSKVARDDALASELWAGSEALLKDYAPKG